MAIGTVFGNLSQEMELWDWIFDEQEPPQYPLQPAGNWVVEGLDRLGDSSEQPAPAPAPTTPPVISPERRQGELWDLRKSKPTAYTTVAAGTAVAIALGRTLLASRSAFAVARLHPVLLGAVVLGGIAALALSTEEPRRTSMA